VFAVQQKLYDVQLEVVVDAGPDRPEPRRTGAGLRPPWWLAGLAVVMVIAVAQDQNSLVHMIAASSAPALAGCAWVLARYDRPS
jgi:hypothetical protein